MSDVLTHARHDPALGLAAVFTALPRREHARPKLDVVQMFNEAEIRWQGPEALTPSDQTVLLTLQALGAVQDLKLRPGSETVTACSLRDKLEMKGDVEHETLVAVRATWRELIEALVLKGRGGSTREQIRNSVRRLAEVCTEVTVNGVTVRSRLLSWHIDDGNRVTIALNWRLLPGNLWRAVRPNIARRATATQLRCGTVATRLALVVPAVLQCSSLSD